MGCRVTKTGEAVGRSDGTKLGTITSPNYFTCLKVPAQVEHYSGMCLT